EAAGALVLVLADKDPEVRAAAAEALWILGPDAAEPVVHFLATWPGDLDPVHAGLLGKLHLTDGVDILLRHQSSRSADTRAAVAQALGRIGSKKALPGLLDLLRDFAQVVRIAAARALAELGDETAVNPLLDELHDDDPAMRVAAVEALGAIASRKSTDALTSLTGTDPSPLVRRAAEQSLRHIGRHTVEPEVRRLASAELPVRIQAMTALLAEGRAAVLPLRDLLAHSEPTVRASAAEVLGALGDPAGLEALGLSLGDPDAQVRLAAATALGRIRQPHSAELLGQVLEDPDEKVAAAATSGLETLGELAIEPLVRLLASERPETRVRATDVLGRLRHKGACARLTSALDDQTAWVRIVSCQALGEICETSAVPALVKVLSDRDVVVRAMAAEALGKLKDYQATMPLLQRLSDPSELVRAHALRALGRIGNPVCLPYLEGALDDHEQDARLAAIEGLVAMGAVKALPRLRELARRWPFNREPAEIRHAARWAVDSLELLEPAEDNWPKT
ncbi:HEAT repeat domain-containing protein, partial [candidate division WOR-3 bacterium]|nr:HEAT repeat domain-containing protein [candidate division WOR-3 bacterium]